MYRRKDSYYQRAKAAGYRSRAAYKLLELNRSQRIIAPGDRVLDLGAWPGGWLQVAAEAVGPRGRVVGVDLVALSPLGHAWAHIVVGDVDDENVRARVAAALDGRADVVLSDMAPKLSGVRDRDEAAATVLAGLALAAARRFLRHGGRMVVKLFTSESTRTVLGEFEKHFERVSTTRPEATRKGSSELYVVATGFRGGGV